MRFALLLVALLVVGCDHQQARSTVSPVASAAGALPIVDVTVDWENSRASAEPPGANASLTATDGSGLALRSLEARAVLEGPLAFTELHFVFWNPEPREREGTFAVALPPGAAVSRFAMLLPAGWQEGEIVEREAARTTFESFLHKRVDPAMLVRDAGNLFRARVYPIAPNSRKEIVLSYSQEIVGDRDAYRIPLRGLPWMDDLSIRLLVPGQNAAYVLHRSQVKPERDFHYVPPKGNVEAVRGGRYAIIRIPASPLPPSAPLGSVGVLIDSSASRGVVTGAYVATLTKLEEALKSLGATSVKIACFDQETEPQSSFRDASARIPGGASDLRSGLRWLKSAGTERAIVVSDGIPTLGALEAKDLASEVLALQASGLQRLDAIGVGRYDDALLNALVQAGLTQKGVVVDAERATPAEIARSLASGPRAAKRIQVPGATGVWPSVVEAEALSDSLLVFVEIDPSLPLRLSLEGSLREYRAEPVEPPLAERAVVLARLRQLVKDRDSPSTSEGDRAELRKQIVDLSTRYRVLTEFTAMLVLETEQDYARFGIRRNALKDVLVVGVRGVDLLARTRLVVGGRQGLFTLFPERENTDSDQDGIPDRDDKCPTEPELYNGLEDEDGCPDRPRVMITSSSIQIRNYVLFDEGSVTIKSESVPLLDAVVEVMKQHPEITLVEIAGHTDSTGSAAGNQKVSEDRAKAVLNYVVKKGLEKARFVTRGYGATRPIAPSLTAEGRARNRRVEFTLLDRVWNPSVSKGIPQGAANAGTLGDVDKLLAQNKAQEALQVADSWRARAPRDLLAAVAQGNALKGLGRWSAAARAYGSVIDLATRPEHRRAAAGYLESLSSTWPAASTLALEVYRRGLIDTPELPTARRLLAYSLARAGHTEQALSTILEGIDRQPDRRFVGATTLLQLDAGILGAAHVRAQPKERAATESRLRARSLQLSTVPSVTMVLSWESDESDLDLQLLDAVNNAMTPSDLRIKHGGELLGDARNGYGPEALVGLRTTGTYHLRVFLAALGPAGHALGKVAIVRQDGKGELTFEDRPFALTNERAAVDLGVYRP